MTKRRRRHGVRGEEVTDPACPDLTLRQLFGLTIGPWADGFESEDEATRQWWRHRSVLLAQERAGKRPLAWWIVEAREDRPTGREAERLEELGELKDEEKKELQAA